MTYAPDWPEAQREQWIADYRAGRPVLMPHLEHDAGECKHCDLLRALMEEADRRDDAAAALGDQDSSPRIT